jgi:hypothetical protein
MRSRAIGLVVEEDEAMPGGVIRPFWLPVTITSTPQSSM